MKKPEWNKNEIKWKPYDIKRTVEAKLKIKIEIKKRSKNEIKMK